jgi:tetratricopeptide (TPR) repeat protein
MKKIFLLFILFVFFNQIFGQSTTTDYKSYHNSALTLLINGDYENSLKTINKSIAINPNNADSYYIRGNVYQKQTKYSDALSEYQRAIKLNPNHTDAIMKCGIIFGQSNDRITACKYFKKACDLGDNDGCGAYNRFCN